MIRFSGVTDEKIMMVVMNRIKWGERERERGRERDRCSVTQIYTLT